MPLFDPLRLELFATEHAPSYSDAKRAMLTLHQLVGRRLDGTLAALTETRVEQSFNERIFAEVFGYHSVLRAGAGLFHIMAKNYYPADGEARKGADDLALGFFGPEREAPEIVASVELKDPGQDLDKPEAGYEHRSPVQQAFDRVRGRGISWIIVSNLYQVRLYSADDDTRHESIALAEVMSVPQFVRAHALLSRRTLLGALAPISTLSATTASPLSPLKRLLLGGPPHMLEERTDSLRLVHEAFVPGGTEIPLHQLEDGLLAAFGQMPTAGDYGAWPPHVPGALAFELEDDRLVLAPEAGGRRIGRLEFSTSGILRVTEYLEPGGEPSRTLSGSSLPVRIALFVLFAKCAFPTSNVQFRWRLLDLAGSRARVPAVWVRNRTELIGVGDRATVSRAHAEPDLRLLNDALLLADVANVLRELLFPFRHVVELTKATVRARMSPEDLRTVIGPALAVLATIRREAQEELDAATMEDDLTAIGSGLDE